MPRITLAFARVVTKAELLPCAKIVVKDVEAPRRLSCHSLIGTMCRDWYMDAFTIEVSGINTRHIYHDFRKLVLRLIIPRRVPPKPESLELAQIKQADIQETLDLTSRFLRTMTQSAYVHTRRKHGAVLPLLFAKKS